MVRNATDIDESSCNTNSQQLTILSQDGFTTTFDCTSPVLASNSGEFPEPTVSLNLSSNRVAISACNFRVVCPTPPVNPKYVFLNFIVSQANFDLPPEQQATVEFQTTMTLRNYQ